MTATLADRLAATLRCPYDGATLTLQGVYGPRGARFARFLCPDCETSYAEGGAIIQRQLHGRLTTTN